MQLWPWHWCMQLHWCRLVLHRCGWPLGRGPRTGPNTCMLATHQLSPAAVSAAVMQSVCHLTPEHSASQLHSQDFTSSVEPTPRATPRSARKPGSTGLPPRESMSSQKHLERLQSARQYGTYRPSSSGGSITVAPISLTAMSGSLSHRQLYTEPVSSSINLKEQASKLMTGGSTMRVSAAHGGIPSSR